jgi:hypothetical protein
MSETGRVKIMKRITMKLRKIAKSFYQRFMTREAEKRIGFIFGCQRSGTTMLADSFQRDFRTKVYAEHGLARGWGRGSKYRLRPYEEIEKIFARERAGLLVAKPLVESQNVLKLLGDFPTSKALWIYRHYKDVGRSQAAYFGRETTVYNLKAVVDPELSDHWFAENVSEKTREVVQKYVGSDTPLYDLAVINWYVRNRLYFEQELFDHPRVLLCRYEDFTAEPRAVMRKIYSFLDYRYPGDSVVRNIHARSVKRGPEIVLGKDVEHLCSDLLQRLDDVRLAGPVTA